MVQRIYRASNLVLLAPARREENGVDDGDCGFGDEAGADNATGRQGAPSNPPICTIHASSPCFALPSKIAPLLPSPFAAERAVDNQRHMLGSPVAHLVRRKAGSVDS